MNEVGLVDVQTLEVVEPVASSWPIGRKLWRVGLQALNRTNIFELRLL
jgi:hypothetical protein